MGECYIYGNNVPVLDARHPWNAVSAHSGSIQSLQREIERAGVPILAEGVWKSYN